jgi:hypothetical protein
MHLISITTLIAVAVKAIVAIAEVVVHINRLHHCFLTQLLLRLQKMNFQAVPTTRKNMKCWNMNRVAATKDIQFRVCAMVLASSIIKMAVTTKVSGEIIK